MHDTVETCELWNGKRWIAIALEKALTLDPSRVKRCRECGGKVRAHKASSDGMVAHFEHFERHPGCSLGECFDGRKRLHPRAVK